MSSKSRFSLQFCILTRFMFPALLVDTVFCCSFLFDASVGFFFLQYTLKPGSHTLGRFPGTQNFT